MNAHGGSSRWGRLVLAAAAVLVVGTLIVPAAALAKTVTRIVVVKSVTVDNGDPLASAWPHALSVRLQRRASARRYVALSGSVKVYRYDDDDKSYAYVMKRTGSSVSFPMPSRGKFKFVYSATSKRKSCVAYCTLFEDIGFELTFTDMTVTPASPSQSWITFTYAGSWNQNAWSAPVWLSSEMDFGSTESFEVYYERRLQAPGTVEFTFKLDNADIGPELWDTAREYVSPYDDPYIIESEWLEGHHFMTS